MLTDLCRSQLSDANNAFPFHSSATDAFDCNVAMVSQAIELWSGAQLNAYDIRQVAHQATGPTGHVLARRAFTFVTMKAQVDYRMLRDVDAQEVRDLLRAGWFVGLFIDCGYLRQVAPELVGDRSYDGAHAVGLFDWWRGQAGASTHLANPLFDGRKRGTWTAPKGVQAAKFSHLRDSAFSYSGAELINGWTVKPRGRV